MLYIVAQCSEVVQRILILDSWPECLAHMLIFRTGIRFLSGLIEEPPTKITVCLSPWLRAGMLSSFGLWDGPSLQGFVQAE